MNARKYNLLALLIAIAILPLTAHSEPIKGPVVKFKHFGATSQSRAITAKPGQTITILIEETCPDKFDFELGGIDLIVPIVPSDPSLAGDKSCAAKTHKLTQIHDKRYGGYYVKVKKKLPGTTVTAKSGALESELDDIEFLIQVTTSDWDLGFSGAFTISDLTNPVFASKSQTLGDGTMQNVIVQDSSAEDDAALGLAGMIHLYHRKQPNLAISFGLAINDQSDTSYLLGPSWRFSDKAALTLGYMWSSVDRLPSGLAVGDTITDANALSNLGSKVEGGVFLAFSYSFLPGIKDLFEKPFKGTSSNDGGGASAQAQAQATDSPPTPAQCKPCKDKDDPEVDCDADGKTADKDPDDCAAG